MIIAGFLAIFGATLLPSSQVTAASIIVTTTVDERNVNGRCSLREAIINANHNNQSGSTDCVGGSGADTITFSITTNGTPIVLAIPNNNQDTEANGDLDIIDDLTLTGNGVDATIIDGNGIVRVFEIRPLNTSLRVNLSAMTIRNGKATTADNDGREGGGLEAYGNINAVLQLTLSNLKVAGNNSQGNGGGIHIIGYVDAGIFNSLIISNTSGEFGGGIGFQGISEPLVIRTSNIISNTAAQTGGGIFGVGSCVTLIESTVSANNAGTNGLGGGGGIHGCGNISNSTLSGNKAGNGGGVSGNFQLRNATIAFNSANQASGGVRAEAGSTAKNSLVVKNQPTDCGSTPLNSLGNNIASDSSCNFTASFDFINTDPLLEPLGNNGGATQTHALGLNSPAIDRGDNSVGTCRHADQRGFPRPVDGNGDKSAQCDIGAFEAKPIPLDSFSLSTHTNGALGNQWAGDKTLDKYKVVDNKLDVATGGPIYWRADNFGADQQVFVVLSKVDPNGLHQSVLLKVQGTWNQGTLAVFYNATTKKIGVENYVPNQGWKTIKTFSRTLRNGDHFGARAQSNGVVRVYVNGVEIGSAQVDKFFDNKGGRVGLWFTDATHAILDDFAGATIVP
jgi:CSLREA domain-containing protein